MGQPKGMSEFVGNRDRQISRVFETSIDDDVAELILVDASKHQRSILEADIQRLARQGLARCHRVPRDLDAGHRSPQLRCCIDGGDFVWGCVRCGPNVDAVAGVVGDVNDSVMFCREPGAFSQDNEEERCGHGAQSDQAITNSQPTCA